MALAPATRQTKLSFRLEGLSFLVPAALTLLPVLALAWFSREKNEAYEWNQHRLAGAVFAGAFLVTFLFGRWQRGWATALSGLVALVAAGALMRRGVPGFSAWFLVSGTMVAIGYRLARRHEPPAWVETLTMGLISALSFWAVSRLSWWQPFGVTLTAWPNKFLFLGATALLVWLLAQLEAPDDKAGPERVWLGRAIDALTLVALAVVVLRTTFLWGNPDFPHHWSVYVGPAEMVRTGHPLLGTTPSQYGFLSTLVLAAMPTADCFTALFWVSTTLVWLSGLVVYHALRTWLARGWWRLGAGLITLCCVSFLSGDASTLSGPLVYPSVGAMRFIWVHLLLGFVLWWHRRGAGVSAGEISRRLWAGSALWLLGVLWSIESAVYVTATWLPAASLLALDPGVAQLGRAARLRALAAGIGRAVGITGLLLAASVLLIAAGYHLFLSQAPVWSAYWEYAVAFSNGFGVLPIEPGGGVWVLLLLHAALLAALVSRRLDTERSAIALLWAAWGALWVVSTYYISRSHINNINNLSPLLLLIVALLGHAVKSAGRPSLARPWVWIVVPPFVGAMGWLVLTNPDALKRQLADYFVEPRTARLLPPTPPGLEEIIRQCLHEQPGPYTVLASTASEALLAEIATPHEDWLPLRSPPLFNPLSAQRRDHYLDAFNPGRTPGWLISPVQRSDQDLAWLFNYIDNRYSAQITLEGEGWQASYCTPRPNWSPDAPRP